MLYSTLETITVASTDRRVTYVAPGRFEAPNWSKDNMLVFNGDGRLHRIPVDGGKPVAIDTGIATRLNNDHAISPDGTMVAISDQSQEQHQSLIYVAPIGGGPARRGHRISTGGRRMARRWHSAESATATSTSTRFRRRAAKRRG